MRFPIPVRNAKTGEEKNFYDKQEIADFLATEENPEDWEGFAHLGELPVPIGTEVAEEPGEVVEAEGNQQVSGDSVDENAGDPAPAKATKPAAPVKRAAKKVGK